MNKPYPKVMASKYTEGLLNMEAFFDTDRTTRYIYDGETEFISYQDDNLPIQPNSPRIKSQ